MSCTIGSLWINASAWAWRCLARAWVRCTGLLVTGPISTVSSTALAAGCSALMAACSFSIAAGLLTEALCTRSVHTAPAVATSCDCNANSRASVLTASVASSCATRLAHMSLKSVLKSVLRSVLRPASRGTSASTEVTIVATDSGAACPIFTWLAG